MVLFSTSANEGGDALSALGLGGSTPGSFSSFLNGLEFSLSLLASLADLPCRLMLPPSTSNASYNFVFAFFLGVLRTSETASDGVAVVVATATATAAETSSASDLMMSAVSSFARSSSMRSSAAAEEVAGVATVVDLERVARVGLNLRIAWATCFSVEESHPPNPTYFASDNEVATEGQLGDLGAPHPHSKWGRPEGALAAAVVRPMREESPYRASHKDVK